MKYSQNGDVNHIRCEVKEPMSHHYPSYLNLNLNINY